MIKTIGMISAVAMPFFDIPLIARVIQRKSSEDISLVWTVGIYVCILGMLPSSCVSSDPIMVAFGVVNAALFSAVVVAVFWYHPAIRNRLGLKPLAASAAAPKAVPTAPERPLSS